MQSDATAADLRLAAGAAPPPSLHPRRRRANARAAGVGTGSAAPTMLDEAAGARALHRVPDQLPGAARSGRTSRGSRSRQRLGAASAPQAASVAARQCGGLLPRRLRLGAGRRRQGLRDRLLRAGDRRARARRSPGYAPIYGVPPDLVRCTRPDGTTGRGRVDADRHLRALLRPRRDRGRRARRQGARDRLGGRSGRAVLPRDPGFGPRSAPRRNVHADRLCRAERAATIPAIGKLLRDRGMLPPGGANMQAIKDWIRANPDQGRELMRENKTYVFFRELTGPGPLGALGVPVTPHGTVAADPKFVPLGAPVFLVDGPAATPNGLWVAQDTGGAIKGSNRFDTFWGAGPEADAIAGGMSANGRRVASCCRRASRPVRSLSPEEAALWARVTATIRAAIAREGRPQARRSSYHSKPPQAGCQAARSRRSPKVARRGRNRAALARRSTAAGTSRLALGRCRSPTASSISTA